MADDNVAQRSGGIGCCGIGGLLLIAGGIMYAVAENSCSDSNTMGVTVTAMPSMASSTAAVTTAAMTTAANATMTMVANTTNSFTNTLFTLMLSDYMQKCDEQLLYAGKVTMIVGASFIGLACCCAASLICCVVVAGGMGA